MQNIIIRDKSSPYRGGSRELPGLTNLSACHEHLLLGINNIEERSKLVMKIKSQGLTPERKDVQQGHEGFKLAGLDSLKYRF